MTIPVVLSWSGGKDSSLVLAALRSDPSYDLVALLTTYSADDRRVTGHGIPIELIEAQAVELEVPLIAAPLPPMAPNTVYERAMRAAAERARVLRADLNCIAYGDLYLEEIRVFREQLAGRSGMTALFPLWGRDTRALARAFVDDGFIARVVSVDTTQLDARFVGRAFDDDFLNALPASVDPSGENGEFHTFVNGGPIFRRPIAVTGEAVRLENARFARCELRLDKDA